MYTKAIKLALIGIFSTAAIFAGLHGFPAQAYATGPPLSRTGAPALGSFGAEPTCATSGCHTSFPLNSGSGTFSITGVPTYYWPDQEFTVTVTLSQASRPSFGFQLTVLDTTGKNIGTLTASDTTRTYISTASGTYSGRKYIQQNYTGSTATTVNGVTQASWSFKWKAPSAASGKITFYGSGNAANNNGSDTGDYIYTKNVSTDPLPFGTTSSASYDPLNVVTSEMISSIFSVGLASDVLVATPNQPLPSQLGDTVVEVQNSVGGISNADLFFVSSQQINFMVPKNTPQGTAILRVKRAGTVVAQGSIDVQRLSPGLFSSTGDGKGIAAAFALRVVNGQVTYEPVVRINPVTSQLEAVPIDLGPDNNSVYLVLYGTGIRGISGLSAAGVTLRGLQMPVIYAGSVGEFYGLDQVNVGPIPRSMIGAGAVNIVFTGETKTANTLSVTFK